MFCICHMDCFQHVDDWGIWLPVWTQNTWPVQAYQSWCLQEVLRPKATKKPARNEPIAQTFKGSNLPVNSLAKTFDFEVRVYGHIQVRRIAMVLYGMVKLLLMSDFSKSLNIRVCLSNKIFKTDVTLTACSNTVYTPPSTNFLLPPWRKECKCKRKALKCQKPTTHFKIGVNLMLTRKVMAAW